MPVRASASDGPVWLVKASDLATMRSAGLDQALGTQAFSPPSLEAFGITSSPYAGLSAGAPARIFTSYTALKSAFTKGWLPGPFTWVVFDLEAGKGWPTPWTEAQHPGYYEKLASELAHAHGMKIVNTPARDLANAATPAPSDATAWYLSSNQAGMAARHANAIVIQGQRLDGNAASYQKFISAAAAQARSANPNVRVWAGLSTCAGGVPVTSSQLFAAYQSVFPAPVSGFWLNVPVWPACPDGNPLAAAEFLADVYS